MRYLAFALGAFFTVIGALAYYERYYRWRDCFNELGRCYDSQMQTVYLEQAGIAWGGLTLIGLLITALALRAIIRKGRAKSKTPR